MVGINTSDKSKPYLFQMLEKSEANTIPTSTQTLPIEEVPKTINSASQLAPKQPADKGGKLVGQIVSNKSHASENQGTLQTNTKSKKDESNTKPARKAPEPLSELKSGNNPKSSQLTEEMDPQHEESQMDNDIFLSESVGIDVSVDSTALNQFDYNESVDLNN